MTFQTSKPELRTLAALLKYDIEDMFNAWESAKALRTGAPHASAILAPENEWCLRRHVLTALYPESVERVEQKPWTALQNAVFLNGWMLHEKYQRLFAEYGNVIEVETSHFDETRFLYFTPDAIIEFGGVPYVVEIKGYKQETWQNLDEAGAPPQAAHAQCNLYCHILEIQYGIILVENKNTQEIKAWVIERDPTLAREYTDRCYQVKGKVATKSIPERACSSCKDRRAEKCPVRNFCFSGPLEGADREEHLAARMDWSGVSRRCGDGPGGGRWHRAAGAAVRR
jgi:hypothetical protein